MGSHPTLDQQQLAAEALVIHPDDWRHGHAVAHLANHSQVRAWADDNPDLAYDLDHRARIEDHHRPTERAAEQASDQLNPAFGVPDARSNYIGQSDVAQREAALALGVRVAVHDSRQNDRDPVIWQSGQDYRAADALHAARTQPSPRPARPRGDRPRTLTSTSKEKRAHGSGQPHHHRRQPGRRPRAPLHQHRHRRHQPAGGRHPAHPTGRRVARTASGATATPASSRSTSGGARPSTWPTPSARGTG